MEKPQFFRKFSVVLITIYSILVAYIILSFFFGTEYKLSFTLFSTVMLFVFAVDHSSQRLGWRLALLLLGSTFVVCLILESVGVATGWVFGKYAYTDKLGFKFLGLVPLLIPTAWFMMSYPSFIIAIRLIPYKNNSLIWRLSVAALGAVIMTAWDLALDPVMVADEYWVWNEPGAYFGIPLLNYWGWWLTIFLTFILFLVLGRLTPSKLETTDPGFERQAVLSYAIAGLSTVVVDLQIGLDGPALVGLFAMLPWVLMGWMVKQ